MARHTAGVTHSITELDMCSMCFYYVADSFVILPPRQASYCAITLKSSSPFRNNSTDRHHDLCDTDLYRSCQTLPVPHICFPARNDSHPCTWALFHCLQVIFLRPCCRDPPLGFYLRVCSGVFDHCIIFLGCLLA